MVENIHKGHRERVRDRFMEEGLDSFKDHEVLELLLFYCVRQKDTNELAHRMLKEY
jgi:DNA repair protein RadC